MIMKSKMKKEWQLSKNFSNLTEPILKNKENNMSRGQVKQCKTLVCRNISDLLKNVEDAALFYH